MVLKTFSTSDLPQRAVIAIHGWTGTVTSMEPVIKALKIPDTHWVTPQAPYKSDKTGYTWFKGDDVKGWQYEESFELLSHVIESLCQKGFEYHQIYFLGFSQGACLSMEFMVRQSFSIGGIIPIAGFIRYKKRLKLDATDPSKKTPILLIHGDRDEIVLPEESEKAYSLFQNLGYTVQFHSVSAGHKIPLKATSLIKQFILTP